MLSSNAESLPMSFGSLYVTTSTRLLFLQSGKPFFGICLGLQLLFEGSEENGGLEGLGIIPGRVTRFEPELGLPVPHIGWNGVKRK